jgi:hypothetical protein
MVGQTTKPDTAGHSEVQSGHFPDLDAKSLPIDHPKRPTVFEPQAKRNTVFETPATPACSPSDQTPLPQEGLLVALNDTLNTQGAVDQSTASDESYVEPLPDPNVCVGCGGFMHTTIGMAWCVRCGYCADPKARQETAVPQPVKRASPVPLWAAILVVGCGAVIAANFYRGTFVPEGSVLGIWWILIEGGAGVAAYVLGSLWAIALTIRHWREHDIFKFLDPSNVWKYAIESLPRTRWSICLAVWGTTAFAYSFVLFWQNDFSFKDRTQKAKVATVSPKMKVADETDSAEVAPAVAEAPADRAEEEARKAATIDLFGADNPEKQRPIHTTDCVVIGYVPNPDDPSQIDQLVIGTRSPDGTIRYAGTVSQFAKSDEVGQWVERVKGLTPLLDTPTYMPGGVNAVPVDPSLQCKIGYSERTNQGVLKGTVVKSVGAPTNGESGPAGK